MDSDHIATLADRNGRVGGLGMADTVAQSLPGDVQDLPFFLLGQDLDGSRLEIQCDL